MGNIAFDLSKRSELYQSEINKSNMNSYLYKDINTDNFIMKHDYKNDSDYFEEANVDLMDMASIKNSLNNILTFKRGEAILEPEFGIGEMYELLYSPFDKYTTQKMLKTLKSILKKWEPRIEVISTPTIYDEEKNEFQITINYFVPELNKNDTFKFLAIR